MLQEQIKNYREMVTLKDGTYILLRAMTPPDKDGLIDMFSAVNQDDLRYMRHNVNDNKLIQRWCDELDYTKVLPILALVKDRIVGNASLHYSDGAERHIAEVRIFLTKDFRKRGLGMKMLKALIDVARKQGVSILTAKIIPEKSKVVKAFKELGFKSSCLLDDYFMFPDGETTDIVLLTLNLQQHIDEF
ncbi:MAG: GNAT family N-acetyltransferase [Anaerolineales bacterium]|nr:GNAT family N-acetyltransferase [Anaerolineales bacterium]